MKPTAMAAIAWMLAITATCVAEHPALSRTADDEALGTTAEEQPVLDTLHWSNGDSLHGRLVNIRGDRLTWDASELFAEPLQIDVSALSSVQLKQTAAETSGPEDEFLITTTNMNVLRGKVTAVRDQEIAFESQRHGQFRLKRDQILHLQRVRSDGLLFLGPHGLDGWEAHGTGNSLTDWAEQNDGSLSSTKGETAICRRLQFPDRCDIEVVLESTSRPDFVISLGARENENPRVEVWGDELICRCGLDFVELGTIAPDQRSLHLHLLVDFKKHVMAVYSQSGRLLGRTTSKSWATPTKGIIFETVESKLTIKRLQISEWNGVLPKDHRPGETRLHRKNGDIHYGQLTGINSESNVFLFDSTADEDNQPSAMEIPVDDVARLVLSTEDREVDHTGKTLVSWRDGGFLSGNMVALEDGIVRITTEYSGEPMQAALSGSRTIRLPDSAKVPEEPDRLFFDGGSLHGTLTMEDQETNPIRWKPIGGLNSSTLISRGNARFQRGDEPAELTIDTKTYPDVLFLRGGDVVPCRIVHADDANLQLVSPIANIAQISVDEVKALELGSLVRRRRTGFADADWKRLSGSATRSDEALSFSSAGSFGHPDILTGNQINFTIRWSSQVYGMVTLKLFAEEIRRPQNATPLNFKLTPNTLFVSSNEPAQQRQMMFFGGKVAEVKKKGLVSVPNRTAKIQCLVRDGKIEVKVNDQDAGAFDLQSETTGGRGINIQTSITRVHNRRIRNAGPADEKNDVPIRISDFTIQNVAGTSVAQFVSEEARERLLTIPRFRRDDPPTHALLAPNGDVLRGRLKSITETHVEFESRLETFRFPRERIAGIVWLRMADDEPTSDRRKDSEVQSRLDNGYTVTFTPQRMLNGQLIGTSSVLGECRVPATAIRDLFLGSPEGRSDILSYVRWIPTMAPEPKWEIPEADGQEHESELIGTIAEDFELQTLKGDLFRLSDHADKVVVLDFWASWCGPCVAALPEYIEATSEFAPSRVIFVAVNLEESEERIQQFLTQQNINPTVALDRGSAIAKRFGVSGIPHSVVLGRGNVVKHVTVGLQSQLKEKTVEKISRLLESPAEK